MIYDYEVTTGKGETLKLSEFKGKVILVVNTATGCGFTPQYEPIEKLYKDYHDQGLEILDIPCNQFGGQAPGDDAEIHSFCTVQFGTTFPRFSKVEVNGDNAIPLYRWLTANTKFEGFGMSPMGMMLSGVVKKTDKDYKHNGNIKWNFTKFLIDRSGEIVARFEPTDMKNLKEKIAACL